MDHEYINKAYDSEETKERKNVILEKIREICLRHNGLCDAGDNVMIVDTNKFNIIERKE